MLGQSQGLTNHPLAGELLLHAGEYEDSHAALKEIETKIKEFKRSKKADASSDELRTESEVAQ